MNWNYQGLERPLSGDLPEMTTGSSWPEPALRGAGVMPMTLVAPNIARMLSKFVASAKLRKNAWPCRFWTARADRATFSGLGW